VFAVFDLINFFSRDEATKLVMKHEQIAEEEAAKLVGIPPEGTDEEESFTVGSENGVEEGDDSEEARFEDNGEENEADPEESFDFGFQEEEEGAASEGGNSTDDLISRFERSVTGAGKHNPNRTSETGWDNTSPTAAKLVR
jgi:hypothetical protein